MIHSALPVYSLLIDDDTPGCTLSVTRTPDAYDLDDASFDYDSLDVPF